MSDYEGHVRYADGTIISLQCFEGRYSECPDDHTSETGNGSLRGYSCESGFDGSQPDAPLISPRDILSMPLAVRAPEIGRLLASIREDIEDCEGGWNGGDVVQLLCEWFTALGFDIDSGEHCASCGDLVQYLSSRNLCDGCEEEADEPDDDEARRVYDHLRSRGYDFTPPGDDPVKDDPAANYQDGPCGDH